MLILTVNFRRRSSSESRLTFTITVYVAAVWNTYRKTRLLALDVIYRCMIRIGNGQTAELEFEAKLIAEEIAASIPYHLKASSAAYCQQSGDTNEGMQSIKTSGGLFLLHPLWVVSICSIIPSEIRRSMQECLRWIGINLGIQQALLLADVSPRALTLNFTMS